MSNSLKAMWEFVALQEKLKRRIFEIGNGPQVGQTYEIYQNEFGCRSGVHYSQSMSYETQKLKPFTGVSFFGEPAKRVGRLRITKLKRIPDRPKPW